MHKIILLIVLFILTTSNICSQEKLTWDDLTDVKFSNVYSAKYGEFFMKPKFGPTVESYQGKRIRIKGYFLDFSIEEDEFYMISKNPRASCFFCGGAGPESVMEIIFKQKPSLKTDQIVEVTGVLELNVDDVDHCNYILKNAIGKLVK